MSALGRKYVHRERRTVDTSKSDRLTLFERAAIVAAGIVWGRIFAQWLGLDVPALLAAFWRMVGRLL